MILPSFVLSQGFGHKMITIHTEPTGAELFLNGNPIGESPATVRVQDGFLAPQYNVRVELDGYRTAIYNLDQHWKPGVACAGTCCGSLFFPAFALLLLAKEHEPVYTIYLIKNN